MIKHIDVIVPCYNEESSLDRFWKESGEAFSAIEGYEFRYIFIDDGSSDETLQKIRRLAALQETAKGEASDAPDPDTILGASDAPGPDTILGTSDAPGPDTILGATGDPAPGNPGACPKVSYISFSRNFGKEAAMYAGLQASDGDFAVIMDADLQHPPQLVAEMIRIVEETGCDSCAARRVSRKGEPKIRSALARAFYKLMNRYSDIEIVDGAVDFRLMNRKMVKAIVGMPENQRFSKGIFAWVGFNTEWIEFENVRRIAGESKWTMWGLMKYALDGFIDFAEAPLKFVGVLGGLTTLCSAVYFIIEFLKTVIVGKDTPGYASTICLILFFGGLIIAILSLIAEYIGRMYMETKGRPIYIEKESNIDEEKERKAD